MSVTWYMIKCMLVSFSIISFLQLKVGSENRTLESYFTTWMTKLSASKKIQTIAMNGKELTNQVVKEFTTEDGSKITVVMPAAAKHLTERYLAEQVQRIIEEGQQSAGDKVRLQDLSDEAKRRLKEEIKKELTMENKSVPLNTN